MRMNPTGVNVYVWLGTPATRPMWFVGHFLRMFNKFHSRRHPILNHKIRTLATIYGVDDDHALPTTDSSHNTYLSFNMECLAVLKIVVVIEPNA